MPRCFGDFCKCDWCYTCPWSYDCEDETYYLDLLYDYYELY